MIKGGKGSGDEGGDKALPALSDSEDEGGEKKVISNHFCLVGRVVLFYAVKHRKIAHNIL